MPERRGAESASELGIQIAQLLPGTRRLRVEWREMRTQVVQPLRPDSRGNLIAVSLSEGENRVGFVDPETSDVRWFASVPAESPVQAIAIPPGNGGS